MTTETTHYELTFIIPGSAPENEHAGTLSKLKDFLAAAQVQNITPTLEIGRKKLAYPINHLRHGFYYCWEFDLLPQNLPPMEKELKINKDILRYILLKKRIKTVAEVAHEEKVKDMQIKEQLKKEQEQIEKKDKPEKIKVSLDDLDKKLDELLNEEIK